VTIIHSNATRQSYEFARAFVVIVGLVTLGSFYMPIYADFSLSDIGKKSVNVFIPMALWQRIMTNPLALQLIQASGLVAFAIALFPFGRPLFVTWAALVATSLDSLGSSGSGSSAGSISHDTATSLYLLYVVVLFDWMEWWRKPTGADMDTFARAALFCIVVLFVLTYSLIGVRRFAYGGPALFLSDTPGHWFVARGHGGIRGHVEYAWTHHLPQWPWVLRAMTAGFAISTVVEVLAPLVLVSRRFALFFVAWMLGFHAMVFVSMDITFWQSVVFFVLFTDFSRWTNARPSETGRNPIVYFDGVCALCNRIVDTLIKWDPNAVLRFAPIQGETARQRIGPREGSPEKWAVVYEDERGVHERSSAVLRAIQRLGWPYMLLALGRLVPAKIREIVYSFVARNRYRWFGKRETCRIPTPQERARFLD
jgi:predicted DCC family thiol-disulfide oxidoreductase YuxK